MIWFQNAETIPHLTDLSVCPLSQRCFGRDDEGLGVSDWSFLQEVRRCSFHWEGYGEWGNYKGHSRIVRKKVGGAGGVGVKAS